MCGVWTVPIMRGTSSVILAAFSSALGPERLPTWRPVAGYTVRTYAPSHSVRTAPPVDRAPPRSPHWATGGPNQSLWMVAC